MKKELKLNIDQNSSVPVYEQLAAELRRLISSKYFSAGEQVPSIRTLADMLDVSPTTIRRAFQILIDEGWLNQQRGSGTYVSDSASLQASFLGKKDEQFKPDSQRSASYELNESLIAGTWYERISAILQSGGTPWLQSDTRASITLDLSPPSERSVNTLNPAAGIALRPLQDNLTRSTNLGDPAGESELREQIAAWVAVTRSIQCGAADIVIVSGTRQAKSIVARLLVSEKTSVVVEDPSGSYTKKLFLSAGARITSVPVDESGIVIDELERVEKPQLLYITPSAQFPTGAVLSRMRKDKMTEWARQKKVLIVEDDAGSEFAYESRITPAIKSLADERTIYIGSFANILPAAWRIAFMIVPKWLREPVFRTKLISERCTAPAAQNVLLQLFKDGQVNKHITRLQRQYQKNRDTVIRNLMEWDSSLIKFTPVKGGTQQTIWLPSTTDDTMISAECAKRGLSVMSISPFFASKPARPGISLNFATVTEPDLLKGLSTLREVITQLHGP